MAKIDIVLVEDHAIVRTLLRSILEQGGDFRVIGEAADGAEGVRLCRARSPQLVLMDMSMPVLSGLEATMELARHCPKVRVVVLSAFHDYSLVVEVVKFGASYVLKNAGVSDLLEALRTVAGGGSYFSPEISNILFSAMRNDRRPVGVEGLSTRETQVMRLVAEGLTSKEVAAALDLSVETVRFHRKALMRKLGVANAAALTRLSLSAMPPVKIEPASSIVSPNRLPKKTLSPSAPSARGQHQNSASI